MVPLLLPPDSEWKPSSYSVLGPARLSPPHRSDSPGPLPPPWLPCPPEPWASQGQAYPRAFSSAGKAPPPAPEILGVAPSPSLSQGNPQDPTWRTRPPPHPAHSLSLPCFPSHQSTGQDRQAIPPTDVRSWQHWSSYVRTSTPCGQGSLSVCLFSSLLWAQYPTAPDTKQTLPRSWWNAGEKACVRACIKLHRWTSLWDSEELVYFKYTGWSSRTCSPPFAEGKDEETRVIQWHTLAPGPELAANWLLRPRRSRGGADTGAGRGAPRKMLPPRSHVHLTPSLWQRLAGRFGSARSPPRGPPQGSSSVTWVSAPGPPPGELRI